MKNELFLLCKELGFAREVIEAILSAPEQDDATIRKFTAALTSPATFREGAKELLARTDSDKTGFSALRIMLCAALRSRELYRLRGISDEIFLDTMKCFVRFVEEHKTSYGYYGFDRGFWVGRQLSLVLFRLGELEYELSELDGSKAVSVHIPSDADLSPELLDRSFAQAKRFFAKQFPDYTNTEYYCDSWLISPVLKELLPAQSKIILFQNRFRMVSFNENEESYKQWVFKKKDLEPQQFPENTSLQRRMKEHVLKGGKVGEALGILRRPSIG